MRIQQSTMASHEITKSSKFQYIGPLCFTSATRMTYFFTSIYSVVYNLYNGLMPYQYDHHQDDLVLAPVWSSFAFN